MNRKRFRLLLLAAMLIGAALLPAPGAADSQCNPWMCWIVDANTVCCWDEFCNLWCG